MGELLRPPPPRSWRERLAARAAVLSPARLASGAGAVLLVAVTAWWLLRPGRLPVEATLPRAGTTAPVTSTTAGAGSGTGGTVSTGTTVPNEPLVVQAAGAVVRPGVYRLPAGARVADLVDAAGGPAPDADLDRVALAARLVDGQRVLVPRVGEAAPAGPVAGESPTPANGTGAGAAAPAGPVDLNSATAADLDQLPGVGPATAAAIVAHRDEHGPFRSVDELTDVPGIGPAKLAALRDLVTV